MSGRECLPHMGAAAVYAVSPATLAHACEHVCVRAHMCVSPDWPGTQLCRDQVGLESQRSTTHLNGVGGT